MLKLIEIKDLALALESMLSASIPMGEAVRKLANIVPSRRHLWVKAARRVEDGEPLSSVLSGEMPEQILSALRAGELSGKTEEVLVSIEQSVTTQMEVQELLSKLVYPVAVFFLSVLVFLFFMTVSVPALGRNLSMKNPNFLLKLSFSIEAFMLAYWPLLVAGISVGIVSAVTWLKTESGRKAFIDAMLKVPRLGDALTYLFFGTWAKYAALMSASGMTVTAMITHTKPILSPSLQVGMEATLAEITESKSLRESLDHRKLPATDPRFGWPLFVSNALILGEETGEFDRHLIKASVPLIHMGRRQFEKFVRIAWLASMTATAVFIGLSLAAYYMQMFGAMSGMGR